MFADSGGARIYKQGARTRRRRRRGGWVWGVCSLPTRERSGEGAIPHPIKIFDFGSQNGVFNCILGTVFYSLRRRREVGCAEGCFFF